MSVPERIAASAQRQTGGFPAAPRRTLHRAVRDLIDDDPIGLLAVLAGIAHDARAKDSDRIVAVRELLDRGYGRAVSLALVADAGEGSALDAAIRDLLATLRPGVPAAAPVLESAPVDGA